MRIVGQAFPYAATHLTLLRYDLGRFVLRPVYTERFLLANTLQHLSDDVHESCALLGNSVRTVKHSPTFYKNPTGIRCLVA